MTTEKLISFHIIEREHNINFLTWSFPTIKDGQKNYILQKCFSASDKNPYTCRRYNNTWVHMYETVEEKSFAIIVLSKEFEPNKYKLLCGTLAKNYSSSQNPVDLVKLYLSLFVSGKCSFGENNFDFKNFECSANVKDFIRSFDLEIILIYTAILLKRRIVMFSSSTKTLLEDLWTVTHLVPSRKIEDYLYCIIDSSSQLKGLSFFVVGTTDRDLIRDEHLYDLFVDMDSLEIKISSRAEEIMVMTKTHKEIASFLVKLSSSDLTEPEVEQQILQKTQDLTNMLQNIASITDNNKKFMTTADLKSKKIHPNLENFLFNLAVAENMMIL